MKHNIRAKAALKYGSETWVLNKRDKQHLEAAQIRFFSPLLGYTIFKHIIRIEKNTSKGCKMRDYQN
jgi:hypothetical protein